MFFGDNLTNLVAGMNVDKDKAANSRFTFLPKSRVELDNAYRGDWLAGKIVDAVAEDLTRQWRSWKAGPRQIAAIDATERQFKVQNLLTRALKMARLYGGSAILIGDGSADPSKELNPESVGKGGLKYLHALSRWELWASTIIRDPLDPHFGEPEYYMLADPTQGGVQIHPSRIIRFQGIPWLELTYTWDGWGFSILERVYETIRNAGAASSNLASMTFETKLDVIKIPNLTQNVTSSDYRERLITRLALANQTKSINNALLLDATEEWDQKTLDLKALPEAIRCFLELAAGAADMPITRLLGTSPKGLNASGDLELRNYYDMLSGKQETDLRPALDRLDDLLLRHAGVPSGKAWYEWNPLWQMTEAEKAALSLQKAQATQIYATMGAMPPTAMRKGIQGQLIEDGVYPGLEAALEEATLAGEEPAPLITKAEVTPNEIDTPSNTARVVKTK